MKTTLKDKNSFTKNLAVSVVWDDLKSDYDTTFNRVKDNYTPPGGRKGKVTGMHLALFKKNYTASIESQFAEDSINKYYKQAIDELKIIPINQGKIIDLKFKEEENLEFSIEFEIKPEFELPKYEKKFKINAIKYIPCDQDLSDALSDLQNRFSSMKEIESGASDDHFLLVDMQELDSGAPVIGKKMEKQYIRLGSGAFKGDVLNSLLGIKKDERRNATIDINGKKIDYDIFIHKVEEQHIPDLSDDFAKSVDPEVKSLDELKNKVNTNINQSFENEHVKSINSAIIDYFVKNTKVEAPESMISNYLDHLVQNNKTQQPNMTDADEEKLRTESKEGSIFNVKWYLIKEKIINSKSIDISKDEIENKKKELIEKDPNNAKNIKIFFKNPENEQRFFDDMLSEKLFMHLKEFATIKVDEKKSDELRKMREASNG